MSDLGEASPASGKSSVWHSETPKVWSESVSITSCELKFDCEKILMKLIGTVALKSLFKKIAVCLDVRVNPPFRGERNAKPSSP